MVRRAPAGEDHGPGEGKASKRPGGIPNWPFSWLSCPGSRACLNACDPAVRQSCGVPPRVAILPPVPAPYREPLFRELAERAVVEPWVVYLAGRQEGWDQPREWFAGREGYRSEVLTGWQWARAGRSPVTVARGLGTALDRIDPACVVSWEYGPATWRALAWCRRRRRPLLIFSEVTPWTEAALSRLQLRVHRLLAPRVDGFIAASSQSAERLVRLGVDRGRVEVALQSADVEPLARARAPRDRRRGSRCACW